MADVYTNSQKHVLLRNGVKMPILGLGTSHQGGYSEEAVICALAECGYRHIDTAKRYGVEAALAKAIQASGVPREDVFLATKCWPSDYGKNTTRAAFEGSCNRFHTEYIEQLLLDNGRVRSIGVSNFDEEDLQLLLEDPELSVCPHVNQCEFHPYHNPTALRHKCQENRIQFEVFNFTLDEADMKIMDSFPQTITLIDKQSIQYKVDHPQPDGYRLSNTNAH